MLLISTIFASCLFGQIFSTCFEVPVKRENAWKSGQNVEFRMDLKPLIQRTHGLPHFQVILEKRQSWFSLPTTRATPYVLKNVKVKRSGPEFRAIHTINCQLPRSMPSGKYSIQIQATTTQAYSYGAMPEYGPYYNNAPSNAAHSSYRPSTVSHYMTVLSCPKGIYVDAYSSENQ